MASNQKPQPVDVTDALEQLGRLPLRDHSMESLLQAVADLITTVMPGNTEASVTLLVKDSPTTVVTTGQLALDLDETQYERGHGPCLHAARSGESVEITDTRAETRWPDYVQRAAEHGNLSSLSVPLAVDEDQLVSGALNIYARQREAFHQDSRSAATRLASYAAVALGNMHAYQSARDTADNLQAALEARAVIDQAKDILMQRHKLTADQAFQVLARASMKVHTKVCKVADHLVHTGELPHRRTITPVNPTVPRDPQATDA